MRGEESVLNIVLDSAGSVTYTYDDGSQVEPDMGPRVVMHVDMVYIYLLLFSFFIHFSSFWLLFIIF